MAPVLVLSGGEVVRVFKPYYCEIVVIDKAIFSYYI